jgi:hypothetical protein
LGWLCSFDGTLRGSRSLRGCSEGRRGNEGDVVAAVSGENYNEETNLLHEQTMQCHYHYQRYHFLSCGTLAARPRTELSTEYSLSKCSDSLIWPFGDER